MQPDRAGIVLAQHDAIEPAFGSGAQREQIDVPVARAHAEVGVERPSELRAQSFRAGAVGRSLRRIR